MRTTPTADAGMARCSVNARSNRILRRFMLKGKFMYSYTDDQVLMFSDEISTMPRKRLCHGPPEELFAEHLDQIYKREARIFYSEKVFNL